MSNKEILEKAIQKAIDGYDIAEDGTVTNKKTSRIVKGSLDRKGYRYFCVYIPERRKQKKVKVHRLVATVHVPNPHNLPFVNHIDGNPANNHASNLEWVTEQYNVIDGFNRGREVWNKGNLSKERMIYLAHKYPRQIFWYLTCNNFAFAKALWGDRYFNAYENDQAVTEEFECMDAYVCDLHTGPRWKIHLRNMVVSEDPIKYLGEHLDVQKQD